MYQGGQWKTYDKQIINKNKFQFDWFYCYKDVADFDLGNLTKEEFVTSISILTNIHMMTSDDPQPDEYL